MHRSSSRLLVFTIVVGVLLSACSSTDRLAAPTEDALTTAEVNESFEPSIPEGDPQEETPAGTQSVGGFTPSTKTCPEKSSYTYRARLWNYLPYPVVIKAGDYDCFDWSGKSTPGNVFNGVVVRSMQSFDVRLEAADNVTRYWTMQFASANSGEVLGTVRMILAAGSDFAIPLESKRRDKLCSYIALDAENPYDTGDYFWPTKEPDDFALLVYEQRVTLVSTCYTPRPE